MHLQAAIQPLHATLNPRLLAALAGWLKVHISPLLSPGRLHPSHSSISPAPLPIIHRCRPLGGPLRSSLRRSREVRLASPPLTEPSAPPAASFALPPSAESPFLTPPFRRIGLLVSLVGALREAALRIWRQRPVHVGLEIASPTVLWVQVRSPMRSHVTSCAISHELTASPMCFSRSRYRLDFDPLWVQPPPMHATPPSLQTHSLSSRSLESQLSLSRELRRAPALALHGLCLQCDEILLSSEEAISSNLPKSPPISPEESMSSNLVRSPPTSSEGGEPSADASSSAAPEMAISPKHSEQAFGLGVRGLSVRLLPPSDCITWLADVSAARGLASPITQPLGAQLTVAVLLQTAGVEVPWVRAALEVDPISVSVHEEELASLTTLAVSSGHALDPEGEGSPAVAAEAAAADGDGAEVAEDSLAGWFGITRTTDVQGRVDTQPLGACYALLELGYLVYETSAVSGETAQTRLKLAEYAPSPSAPLPWPPTSHPFLGLPSLALPLPRSSESAPRAVPPRIPQLSARAVRGACMQVRDPRGCDRRSL